MCNCPILPGMRSSTRPACWGSGSSKSPSITGSRLMCVRLYLKKTLRGGYSDNCPYVEGHHANTAPDYFEGRASSRFKATQRPEKSFLTLAKHLISRPYLLQPAMPPLCHPMKDEIAPLRSMLWEMPAEVKTSRDPRLPGLCTWLYGRLPRKERIIGSMCHNYAADMLMLAAYHQGTDTGAPCSFLCTSAGLYHGLRCSQLLFALGLCFTLIQEPR
jgi:hypothetical protein